MEFQSDSGCARGKNDISISIPMELQMDEVISKLQPKWIFKLTWNVHKGKMISRFPFPANQKSQRYGISTGHGMSCNVISGCARPWNFKLTWHVHKGKRRS
jgi:hypothetical protein